MNKLAQFITDPFIDLPNQYSKSSPNQTPKILNPVQPIKENINEPRQLLLGYIQSLNEYMVNDGMNVQPLPRVELIDNDAKNADDFFGKTGYYNPSTLTITVYSLNRSPRDVLATICHEYIHHIQNLENRLPQINTTNIHEDEKLLEIEREAYEQGGLLLRKFKNHLLPNS